ncbi:MAG TPA: tetratricopeptide repeat protein [Bacteroidetes bacterium]|nr:tetratricopeptide repeat protein [Bacteroidota bacterium]
MKSKKIFFAGLFVLVLAGCSSTSVRLPVTHPAEINLKGFAKIAIGEITGRGSADLSEELTQALFESGRFEVLNRQNLDRILAEHSLALSGVIDEEQAAELGKFLGAAALIFGRVSEHGYKEELTHADYTDKKTGKKTRTYTRSGRARVSATLQVVDLTTGKILAIKKFTKVQTARTSADGERPVKIDPKPLLAKCRSGIIRDFMKKIAPYTEYVSVSFETDKSMPELERGYNMAKVGSWDRAIQLFTQAAKRNRSNPAVHKAWYNLGMAYLYTDRFDRARKALLKAYEIKPEGKYERALKQVEVRRDEQRRLQEQL